MFEQIHMFNFPLNLIFKCINVQFIKNYSYYCLRYTSILNQFDFFLLFLQFMLKIFVFLTLKISTRKHISLLSLDFTNWE